MSLWNTKQTADAAEAPGKRRLKHPKRWVALLLAAAAIGIALPVLRAAVRSPRRTPEPLLGPVVQEVTMLSAMDRPRP